MKNFHQWCEERSFELPLVADMGKEADASENKVRTGIRGYYPSGYVRHEYPDAYFMPKVATAALDLQNAKSSKDKAAPENTPG
tara:strand:+ start:336 stop:584 length:249 start_codon:yes stop_codon:yes gene_type:complete